MKILKAEHLGMCFGVRDAIALAHAQVKQRPLTILGELVHNKTVLEELRHDGVQFAGSPEAVKTQSVMVTAHGASEAAMRRLEQQGLSVSEATCPLVRFAHVALRQLVQAGYHPVIIGRREHVEVRGMTEDLEEFDTVLCEEDVVALGRRERFGIVAQTTQPIDKVRRLVSLIRGRFPEAAVRFSDTVCQPTKQRQKAAVELARQSDVVVVIGGANSNNTRELVETCRRFCHRVFHIQHAGHLDPDWFAGARTVGVTAGTSTPDSAIGEVERWLRERFAEPAVRECEKVHA
jgi:4-hydroxy-3-methylbut-2-en-1-yl diphosphate reductase